MKALISWQAGRLAEQNAVARIITRRYVDRQMQTVADEVVPAYVTARMVYTARGHFSREGGQNRNTWCATFLHSYRVQPYPDGAPWVVTKRGAQFDDPQPLKVSA